ncbi:hypothetical protein LDENG_00202220 [Lucifuga dentata]|nr:hypothetical protein LDENG_00202220 [Lucifuga dentata]
MELQRCVLRIVVHTWELHAMRGTTLGEVEVECGGKDWKAEHQFHFSNELQPNSWKLTKTQSLNLQDALMCKELSCPPQIFILLQYQTLAHCIKAMVLRADNLDSLVHMSETQDYQLVVNVHHEGLVISSRESIGWSGTEWNTPFLFDLPPGHINQLPLMLEFITMQNKVFSKRKVLGQVLIGSEASDAGRADWRDVCNLSQESRHAGTLCNQNFYRALL